ncbi:MAG: hypothetical protein QGG48_11105, partial [Desulfatiglandales bacterium]|nr:hypothetical protein [Desulfatiglandales bacterium]
MNVIDFSETRRDECADFWWHLYEDLPYVHLLDGYQNVNSHTHITPDYFLNRLDWGLRCDTPRRWHGEVRDDTVEQFTTKPYVGDSVIVDFEASSS